MSSDDHSTSTPAPSSSSHGSQYVFYALLKSGVGTMDHAESEDAFLENKAIDRADTVCVAQAKDMEEATQALLQLKAAKICRTLENKEFIEDYISDIPHGGFNIVIVPDTHDEPQYALINTLCANETEFRESAMGKKIFSDNETPLFKVVKDVNEGVQFAKTLGLRKVFIDTEPDSE